MNLLAQYTGRAIGCLLLLLPMALVAQVEPAIPVHHRLDSLLELSLSSRAYYTPQAISDSLLLKLIEQQEVSPMVEYFRTNPASSTFGSSPTILSSLVSLPLATRYTNPAKSRLWARPLTLTRPDSLVLYPYARGKLYRPDPVALMPEYDLKLRLMRHVLYSLQQERLDLFDYGAAALEAQERLGISSKDLSPQVLEHRLEHKSTSQLAENIQRQEIGRRYWIPAFESSVQFSQNHVSDNWHKGGSSNLNLFMRTYFSLTYNRHSINWKIELEDKLSIYNTDKSEKDPVRSFRIADDLIRLRSNFGLKASKRWFYTIDAEARSQLLNNYAYKGKTRQLQSALFSPMTFNVGIGMKFDYSSRSSKVYRRRFAYSMNLAPLSYTLRSTSRRDIDLGRHGLSRDKLRNHRFGSTLRANLQWDLNMNLTWQSRLYFNTSYSKVEAEWENTLDMRISRYFSTRINLQLRYDDAVRPAQGWNKYLQFNELISFGFNYRL